VTRSAETLYETIAHKLAGQIAKGTYRPGDRVPSVRELSRQRKLSVTTVVAAYRMLEDQGLIEARPQSGYYVRARDTRTPIEPEPSAPPCEPCDVSIEDLVMTVQRDMGKPNLTQLAIAVPHPDCLPSERMAKALATAARQLNRGAAFYAAPPGCESLRKQLARRVAMLGCDVPPDEIVTTVGAQEAITLCLRALCKPGDTVALESPTYHGVLQSIESLGLRALELPTHPRDGVSLEALRDTLEERKAQAVFLITNFSNPLGSCMSDERKRELVELITRFDVPLIEDDVYGDLCFSHERPGVAKAHDKKGLVLLCSSVSKTLAPGYRVGWVMPGRYRKRIEYMKMVTNIATATAPQLAVGDFLATGGYDRFLRTVRPVYARRMEAMTQAVLAHFPDPTRVTCPGGGFVLWVELPRDIDALKLYSKAVRAGITFSPGPLFSAKGKYRNCLRLNSAFWTPEVERAIATLGRLAQGR
jgi:DNA-binding transcriptional MocR family regulator